MQETPLGMLLNSWREKPGGLERRLLRFRSLLERLILYGVAVVFCASAVLGLVLILFGAERFQRTLPSLALLVGSLAAGYALATPAARSLLREYRFRCFYCEGDTARAQRHDLNFSNERRTAVRYTFECERCGRSDSAL